MSHPPALVIGGMHRSGTSLVAALCQSAGLFIGARLLPAFHANARGHFEDLDFLEFHQRVLAADGWLDTGFEIRTDGPRVTAAGVADALALVTARRGLSRPWGWKDPRTVLFLDFWAQLLPEAGFLFVFRRPWEVVDSLFRRNDREDSAFRDDPLLALRLWCRYNLLIRDFARAHPGRALVREIDQFIHRPAAVLAGVRQVIGLPAGVPQPLAERELLRGCSEPLGEQLVAAASPESISLYLELRELAGVDGGEAAAAGLSATETNIEQAFASWVLSSQRSDTT